MLENIPREVNEDMNKALQEEVKDEEIKKVMNLFESNKALDPDGYPVGFFHRNWEILGKDVTKAVKEFFTKGKLLKQLNCTFLTLIPKTQEAKEFKDYRPINLCNAVYKLITKIMAGRLKRIIPKLISKEQDGLVKGRQITDGIIMMHEVLHSVKGKNDQAMVLKLDMEKAYDKSELAFFEKSAPKIWIEWKMDIIDKIMYFHSKLFSACEWRSSRFF